MQKKTIKLSLISTAIAALLIGCGGSGGGSDPVKQGTAIDFALSNATVNFVDCNSTTTTNSQGKFNLPPISQCFASEITVTGGTDTVTGQQFDGVLKFKKTDLSMLSNVVVSPLTSLEFYLDKAGKLDQLPAVLAQLGLPAIADVKQFNPETSTSHDMSVVFVLQQLITQIEESLGGNETQTAIAVNAIVNALLAPNAAPLFSPNSALPNAATLTNILNTANVSNTDAALIDQKITQLATLVENVISNPQSSAEELKTELAKEQKAIDTIIDSTITANYTDSGFTFAGHNLATILGSTSTTPLSLSKTGLASNLAVQFKLNSTVAAEDTLKIGLKLTGTRNSTTETLEIIVSNVVVQYNASGVISDITTPATDGAVIPAGTQIAVKTSIAGQPTNTVVSNTQALKINDGNSISLQRLIDSSPRLRAEYDKYLALMAANDNLEASTYISSAAFPIEISTLASDTLEIASLKITGEKITGFFKITP